MGYLINAHQHWFCLRKNKTVGYSLIDSLDDKIKHIFVENNLDDVYSKLPESYKTGSEIFYLVYRLDQPINYIEVLKKEGMILDENNTKKQKKTQELGELIKNKLKRIVYDKSFIRSKYKKTLLKLIDIYDIILSIDINIFTWLINIDIHVVNEKRNKIIIDYIINTFLYFITKQNMENGSHEELMNILKILYKVPLPEVNLLKWNNPDKNKILNEIDGESELKLKAKKMFKSDDLLNLFNPDKDEHRIQIYNLQYKTLKDFIKFHEKKDFADVLKEANLERRRRETALRETIKEAEKAKANTEYEKQKNKIELLNIKRNNQEAENKVSVASEKVVKAKNLMDKLKKYIDENLTDAMQKAAKEVEDAAAKVDEVATQVYKALAASAKAITKAEEADGANNDSVLAAREADTAKLKAREANKWAEEATRVAEEAEAATEKAKADKAALPPKPQQQPLLKPPLPKPQQQPPQPKPQPKPPQPAADPEPPAQEEPAVQEPVATEPEPPPEEPAAAVEEPPPTPPPPTADPAVEADANNANNNGMPMTPEVVQEARGEESQLQTQQISNTNKRLTNAISKPEESSNFEILALLSGIALLGGLIIFI